ncbi:MULTISPECIES: MerR family transcriptional regulator [unclassified Streptomyces]|uniref:MerR family transcriptional regulator n=1 Tax=unclassified Streptomyces TaxID=2593676 RepID=UPI0022B6A937|nr:MULTISPECIES: MerR family transcriptional regulator [unclassified Streptomyces]MCZ7415098.1 MerR family transcriptional regulator [Streptomyces sp. WMMC897]MCZ7432041.1 MerR family transcriptional regulator [Streptomyces sp. WMMC1477]
MSYSVGQVAGFAGVTVRTLHHYDEIGLLVPGERNVAGHRRYSDADLDRLQQILFYRGLGFPLEEVAVLLDDPDADPNEHLRRQYALLTDRAEQLRKMAAAVQHAMEARKMGINLTPEEKFEVFGDFDPERYAEEAERRWGGSDAWAESQRRAASMTKEEWKAAMAEFDAIHRRIAGRMAEDGDPRTAEAMELAEEHRRFLCRTSYDCTFEIHTGLGEMYVADPRFTAYLERFRPGMAAYLRDAIVANAARHGYPAA